jgi:predicted DsbA family dithiol-disulfide isomerase
LFKGYFEEGLNIGEVSVLSELADRAGLKVDQLFASEEGVAEVQAEESVGHRLGIRGVPYFVINNSNGISGAQPVEVFVAAIEKGRLNRSSTTGSL